MNRKINTSHCSFCDSDVKIISQKLTTGKELVVFKCQNPNCGAITYFDNLITDRFPERAIKFFKRRQILMEEYI